MNQQQDKQNQKRLQQIASIPFQQKIEQFSWSPKTTISSLKQTINFAVSDCTQNVVFCNFNLNSLQQEQQGENLQSNIKLVVIFDLIFKEI